MTKPQKNMYKDAFVWNPYKGCEFECTYCIRSFQKQAKREMHRCLKCYNYIPHFHEERLNNQLRLTKGDQFIWACSSGDIYFAKKIWIDSVIDIMKKKKNKKRTFFFQTKDPSCYEKYDFPDNLILGITLETNRDLDYEKISKAPKPSIRSKKFSEIQHKRKFITIEPILDFDIEEFLIMIKSINPERVYIGYDTKNCNLTEPKLEKTLKLIAELEKYTKVVKKLIRESKKPKII